MARCVDLARAEKALRLLDPQTPEERTPWDGRKLTQLW